MAAAAEEARAEEPAPPPPRAEPAPTPPEKRAQEGEERPEPKRRRVCVAALENVPRAAAETASEEDDAGESTDGCDGGSFSFHARNFPGVETTPKFGSFNPAAAEFAAFHLTPPPPLVDSAEAEGNGVDGVVAGGEKEPEGKDGNSHWCGK